MEVPAGLGPRGDRKPGPRPRTANVGACSPAGTELPRPAERPGEPWRREDALHPAPGREKPPGARLGRSARAAGAAGRGACSLRLRAPTPRLGGTGKGGERRALSLTAARGPPPGLDRPGDALQPARPCGDSRRADPARPPPRLPPRQTFRAKTARASPAGAPQDPRGPETVSPPRLRGQDPLKIWRPRTSFLGPLRESRNASLQDPRIPVGAKFQLVGPRKEKAPLVQCGTDSRFSGTESKSCSRPPPGAARVPQPQQLAGGEIAKSRGVVESAGLRVRDRARSSAPAGCLCPEPRPETCLQSGAGVGAASAGMKPLRPRQLSWRGGPAGAEGTLQAGQAAFQSPVTGNPAGAPEGTSSPTAKNPLSGAGCEAVCKPLHPGRVQ